MKKKYDPAKVKLDGYEQSLERRKAQQEDRIVFTSSPASMQDEDYEADNEVNYNGKTSWYFNGPALAELDKAFNASQKASITTVSREGSAEPSKPMET